MPQTTKHTAAFLRILLLGALTSAVVLLLRYQLVEPDDIAQLCLRTNAPAWCGARQWVVLGFAWNAYGWASLVFAITAILTRSAAAATVGLILGLTGALLYRYFPAGLGLLLSALLLSRLWAPPVTGAAREQEAQRRP